MPLESRLGASGLAKSIIFGRQGAAEVAKMMHKKGSVTNIVDEPRAVTALSRLERSSHALTYGAQALTADFVVYDFLTYITHASSGILPSLMLRPFPRKKMALIQSKAVLPALLLPCW